MPKVREIVHKDMGNLAALRSNYRDLTRVFSVWVFRSIGMTEAEYKRITYDLTIGAAETLARLNPG